MKKVEWLNPNKMKINTKHKSFNRYIDAISVGNRAGCGQMSWCIRPYTETKCNGRENPPGHLRDYDLNMFLHLPGHVREYVLRETETELAILYRFYHRARHKDHTLGYILTRGAKQNHKRIRIFNTSLPNSYAKAQDALETCLEYISN